MFRTFFAIKNVVFAVAALAMCGHALAQKPAASTAVGSAVLSPPIAQSSAQGSGVVDLTGGRSGAGVHSPLSPFAPLRERADVLSWTVLTNVTTKLEKNKVVPTFPVPVMALNQKKQRVQGFMMPLQPGETQSHFLLTQVPMSCSFCTPGGPESMIEVRTKTPVKYGFDAVVLEGNFRVLTDDQYGLFYRLTDAVSVK